MPNKINSRRSILAGSIALILLLILLAFAFRSQILTGIANFLIVEDHPLQTADMIFLLNGDYNTRPFRASELYEQGVAPLVVIARCESGPAEEMGLVPNETDIAVGVMEKQGIPPGKIVVLPFEGGVTSTFDEAVVLRGYIEANNIHRIIILTSAFHTRRARWIFDKELSGLPVTLELAAAPHWGFDKTNWWKSEQGLIYLNNEYVKLVYYFWKYR